MNAAGQAADAWERRILDLCSCLEVADLETRLLAELRHEMPRASAIVRIGPGPAPSFVASGRSVRSWREQDPLPRLLVTPIGTVCDQLGFIGYFYDEALEARLPQAERRLLEVARLAVVPARNALRHAEALRLAYRDPLTTLYNRRAFDDYLERESGRAVRHDRPLTLVLADLDGLKAINDTLGHEAGDHAIKTFAEVLSRSVRRADVCARIGGDEFAVLLPDTPEDAGRRIGARIQRALGVHRVGSGRGTQFTLACSFGVASLASAQGEPDRLVALADADLYAAKRARGRLASTGTAP